MAYNARRILDTVLEQMYQRDRVDLFRAIRLLPDQLQSQQGLMLRRFPLPRGPENPLSAAVQVMLEA